MYTKVQLFHENSDPIAQEIQRALRPIYETLTSLNLLPSCITNGVYLCGGAILSSILGTGIRDYDFYFESKRQLKLFREHIITNLKPTKVIATFNAETYHIIPKYGDSEIIVQTIDRKGCLHPTIESVLDTFDFTACRAGINFIEGTLYMHERFYEDAKNKALIFNPTHAFPSGALLRLGKYVSRGFTIDDRNIAHLALKLAKLGSASVTHSDINQALCLYGALDEHKAAIDLAVEPGTLHSIPTFESMFTFLTNLIERTNIW